MSAFTEANDGKPFWAAFPPPKSAPAKGSLKAIMSAMSDVVTFRTKPGGQCVIGLADAPAYPAWRGGPLTSEVRAAVRRCRLNTSG